MFSLIQCRIRLMKSSAWIWLLLVLTVISPPLHHLQENLFFAPVYESSESVHLLFVSPSLFFLLLVRNRAGRKRLLLQVPGSWAGELQLPKNVLVMEVRDCRTMQFCLLPPFFYLPSLVFVQLVHYGLCERLVKAITSNAKLLYKVLLCCFAIFLKKCLGFKTKNQEPKIPNASSNRKKKNMVHFSSLKYTSSS